MAGVNCHLFVGVGAQTWSINYCFFGSNQYHYHIFIIFIGSRPYSQPYPPGTPSCHPSMTPAAAVLRRPWRMRSSIWGKVHPQDRRNSDLVFAENGYGILLCCDEAVDWSFSLRGNHRVTITIILDFLFDAAILGYIMAYVTSIHHTSIPCLPHWWNFQGLTPIWELFPVASLPCTILSATNPPCVFLQKVWCHWAPSPHRSHSNSQKPSD